MYLLDTSVISELRKLSSGKTDSHVRSWASQTLGSTQFLSVITVMELELGALQMERRDARQGALLHAWIDRIVVPAFDGRILAVDSAIAKRCASLHVPNPCSYRDSLIAALRLAPA